MHILTTGWLFGMSEDKTQLDRFKEAARQLETDDDEEQFEEKLRKIVRQKPSDDEKED